MSDEMRCGEGSGQPLSVGRRMFAHGDDTIVAVSSAVGASPRGVLRLTGPRAIGIAAGVFSIGADSPIGFRRYRAGLRWGEEGLQVPAELYVFRAPRSFTRQDLVEIHTVGSAPLLADVLEEMVRNGARIAEPGEFTGRAYLAGAMDLTTVEGVAAMIHAGSDGQLRAAEQLLHGTLAGETARLRSRLVDLLALIEASIDFVDEPTEFLSPREAVAAIAEITAGLRRILRRGLPIERLETRHRVLLLGPPNAGKSTLFNRLTGLDRSICSPEPGTTRDVITAPILLSGGREVWLADSAGVGRAEGGIDELAAGAARQAAGHADLLILVFDATRALASQPWAMLRYAGRARVLVVLNKSDLLPMQSRSNAMADAAELDVPVIAVSAATGEGCGELLTRLSELFQGERIEDGTPSIAMNARHRLALTNARDASQRAETLIRERPRISDGAELIAMELREATAELGTIVGEVATDELLNHVFSRFCIGK